MTPPEEVLKGLVKQWMQRGERDFLVADHLFNTGRLFTEIIGFHAQQSVEKYIKAYLTLHQVEFPKIHDLGVLLDLVAQKDKALAEDLAAVTRLNTYAVDARYPGDYFDIPEDEARRAIDLARDARDKIKAAVEQERPQ